MEVLIAGGGVAGLEALLGLREMAGDRVDPVLIAPDEDFTYRPLAVAEPFALGRAHSVPLSEFAEDAGAELIIDAVIGLDEPRRGAAARPRSAPVRGAPAGHRRPRGDRNRGRHDVVARR